MDGYVLIEVNTEGEMRVQHHDDEMRLEFYDFRLTELDWDNDFIVKSIEGQLPKDITDVLIMVHFTYKPVPDGRGDYWSVDYKDCIIVEDYIIVKTDYKEFYRQMVTEKLALLPYDHEPNSEDTKLYYESLQAEWEEFYDEDFKPFEKKIKTKKWFKRK